MTDINKLMEMRNYTGPIKDPIYNEVRYWYKKAPNAGTHQLIVKEWNHPRLSGPSSYEVEMVYETYGEFWANTKFYSLSFQDLVHYLGKLEGRLVESRLSMGASPTSYQWEESND